MDHPSEWADVTRGLEAASWKRPFVKLGREFVRATDGTRTCDRRDHNPANPVVQRPDLAL
jgi:hypothetical protein